MKNKTEIKKILIIRTDYLGDMLTITPVITNLKRNFPKAEIKALVNSLIGQEVLKHQQGVSEIYRFPPKKPAGLKEIWRLLQWIRKERFDLLLAFASRDDRITILSLLSGARQKIGYDIGLLSRWGYSYAVTNDRTRHEVERNLDFLRALDLGSFDRELIFEITEAEKESVEKLWEEHKLPETVIGIHPCSKRAVKNWQLERFQALTNKLVERYQIPLLFTGAKNDYENIEIIRSKAKQMTFNLAGKTTLGELAAIIQRFKLFITIDSGPMHLAAALKTPQVVLFGAGEINKWYPWGEEEINRVIYKEVGCQPCSLLECETMKCMQSITVGDVLEERSEERRVGKECRSRWSPDH